MKNLWIKPGSKGGLKIVKKSSVVSAPKDEYKPTHKKRVNCYDAIEDRATNFSDNVAQIY